MKFISIIFSSNKSSNSKNVKSISQWLTSNLSNYYACYCEILTPKQCLNLDVDTEILFIYQYIAIRDNYDNRNLNINIYTNTNMENKYILMYIRMCNKSKYIRKHKI